MLRATAEALEGEGSPRVHLQLGDVQQGSPPLDKEQAQAAKVDGGGGGGGRGGGGGGGGGGGAGGVGGGGKAMSVVVAVIGRALEM